MLHNQLQGKRLTSGLQTLPFAWAARFAVARLRAGWRSRLTILIGVLLTTVIGALTPLYTALVAQTGMVRRLDAPPPHTVNIHTQVSLNSSEINASAVWDSLDESVEIAAHTAFDPLSAEWLNTVTGWGESPPMFVLRDGEEIPSLLLRVAAYDDWQSRVTWVDGTATSPTRADYAGVIGLELASRYDLAVGDVITLDQRGWETSIPFTLEITGIAAPQDPDDAYWMSPSPLRLNETQGDTSANILVTRSDLLNVMHDQVPQTRALIGWRFLFDHDALSVGRIEQATAQAQAFERDLTRFLETENDYSLVYSTELPERLTSYAAELVLLNAPFGVLMLQVGGLALFFLVITVALAQRNERREVAMLQNRGALNGQILLLRALEAVIISTAAALIAPFIARQMLIWFAPVLIDTNRITLELDSAPFVYAGAAAALAVIVLLMTLRPVLKLPLISSGGATVRAARQTWWQRYYVDLLLLILGSAALFRLLATDSPFARSLLGGLRADPMLLIAPALLFFALGSVTLRLFPLLTDAAARALAARRDIAGALAAWTVSRDPAQYAQIAFLLALSIGVGWFSVSFQATLTRSHTDQALYRVGADVRMTELDPVTGEIRTDAPDSIQTLEGVESASASFRAPDLNFSLDGLRVTPGTLLGVESASFERAAYWRDDLGALVLPPAAETPDMSAVIPSDATRIGVWVRLDEVIIDQTTGEWSSGLPLIQYLYGNVTLFARVKDAQGTFRIVPLLPQFIEGAEDVEDIFQFSFNVTPFASPEQIQAERDRLNALLEGVSGWIYYEGEIIPPDQGDLRLDMIYWRNTSGGGFGNFTRSSRLTAAGLVALDSSGAPLSENLFVGSGEWSITFDNASNTDGTTTPLEVNKGSGVRIDWVQFQDQSVLGITLMPPAAPVPAIVSASFAAENALEPSAVFDLYLESRPVSLEVAGTADYFPTLYADQAPFAVADIDALLGVLNRRPGSTYYANEMIVALAPGIDADAWLQNRALTAGDRVPMSALTAEDIRSQLTGDVMTLGVSRLLFMAFGIALILSVVSMVVYAALNAQNRSTQFAVLRALGMSSGRIALIGGFEQAVVFMVAVLLGGVMGALLSGLVLPSLAISADSGAITPPFLVEIEVAALIQYFVALTILMAFVVAFTALLIRRLSLGQSLRFQGE